MPTSVQISCLVMLAGVLAACGRHETPPSSPPEPGPAEFIGGAACAECHAEEHRLWQDSHHALAMLHADETTVLGDFDNASVEIRGVTSIFFRRDGAYMVRTEDAVGDIAEFRLPYTFGVTPLQQYLAELPGGRLQALSIAWDSRPASEGGQRWFHLYPDERIAPGDPLHWTGRNQNWNYMCAECHSTNLTKNYDADTDRFDTRWTDINVGCEACHGPGSRHVERARAGVRTPGGFPVDLDDRRDATWVMDPATGIASRSEPRLRPPQQPDACGRCHSRRSVLTNDYEFGRSLLDTHLPSLLDDGLYFADGQIDDEVYVWGSFMQSAMYEAGVTCTDCHDAHSTALRGAAGPSEICAGCHLPQRFDTTDHHGHDAHTVGCVDCHMPARSYMVVDPRRDHSFRIPRPDITLSAGAPNACANCHEEQGAEWADAAIRRWYGAERKPHFAEALHAARIGTAGADAGLAAMAADTRYPAIARATALSMIRGPLDSGTAQALKAGVDDPDPLVRIGALRGLASQDAEPLLRWAQPLLADPRRAVRLEAVSALAAVQGALPPSSTRAWQQAAAEYVETQLAVIERPEASLNLGSFFTARGDAGRAESSFQRALRMEPDLVPARVNLADLYRQTGREDEGRAVLEEGLSRSPDNAALNFAFGLLLVRQDRAGEALESFRRAMASEPDTSRYAYVYGVALNSQGRADEAIDVLDQAHRRFPGDYDIGWALATVLRDAGREPAALDVAVKMQAIFRDDRGLAELIESLTDR